MRQWRIVFKDDAWDDQAHLTDIEREAVQAELATWVPGGPAGAPVRVYETFARFEVFERRVGSCVIVYQIIEATGISVSFVEVVRIRRLRSDELD